ncbi:MAG: hypothetical protein A2075_25155 [Geobacteraceae bacterium GWC2_58_44]|nr:MAG: hypothetical protein A2075_25155 [Geobacteraceae bacterium GWC2_58_44]HBG05350.1 hypothetical protein [Geobacter sp.]
MKKKLLAILFPVMLTLVCVFGVWANEQSAVQPCCDKSVKVSQPGGCDNCAKGGKAGAGCENCAKKQAAAATPCGSMGCDNCAKAQQTEKKQQAVTQPCCDKSKPQ